MRNEKCVGEFSFPITFSLKRKNLKIHTLKTQSTEKNQFSLLVLACVALFGEFKLATVVCGGYYAIKLIVSLLYEIQFFV